MVSQGAEMENGLRRSHQRAETPARAEAMLLPRCGRHGTMGWVRGDRRYVNQHGNSSGESEQQIEGTGSPRIKNVLGEQKIRWCRNAAPEWAPESISREFNLSETSFLRRKVATLDGAGHFVSRFTMSHNGEISTLPSDIGTYTVNSDCTGTITDETAGTHFATVILSGGTELFAVQTDVGTAAILDARKQ